jgi:hypothetical protein
LSLSLNTKFTLMNFESFSISIFSSVNISS